MSLVTKNYTPTTGQAADASAYNTDIAAIVNTINGIDEQTTALHGATVTPTANSTTTLKITNAAGTSVVSVDTTSSKLIALNTEIQPASNSTTTLNVKNASGSSVFSVDTSNGKIIGNGSGLTNLVPIAAGNFKMGQLTRDVSVASGTQAVTGVGFTPSLVIFFANAVIGGSDNYASSGFDDGTTAYSVGRYGTSITNNPNYSIGYSLYLGTGYEGKITAFGVDGFTVTWSKTGTPTGSISVTYLAIR